MRIPRKLSEKDIRDWNAMDDGDHDSWRKMSVDIAVGYAQRYVKFEQFSSIQAYLIAYI